MMSETAHSTKESIALAWLTLLCTLTVLLVGVVLTFAHTLGEFGVVLMIGGNIPGITQTVSIAIYDDVQALDYTSANHTALLLLLFSFAFLSILYAVNRRMWAVWPMHR
jgi:molybdate transport system permease protein